MASESLQTPASEVKAAPGWRTVDFISDLHLQAREAATFAAWQRYMASTAADALFILGDLFEVWVGDDITTATDDPDAAFARQCQKVLLATSARLPVYFMHGNRDFLLGEHFAKACGMTLLPDPTGLDFDGQRYLLCHGDALCLGDVDYQQFRLQVRKPAWQTQFLAQPLTERQAMARGLRAQSAARKDSGATYADVDPTAAVLCLQANGASTLIHGHTHRPQDHTLDATAQPPLRRLVLSDWDATAPSPRLEVLRLQAGHAPRRVALAPAR
ncbi:MAG: UDP-2,3-diacylglucosamine diphosphatase [Rhodoferax sp.]|nr:UDP-2,3-diacylglucosamine diphosphatase [Rhodoferax sp.]